jgi:hypothetical protein
VIETASVYVDDWEVGFDTVYTPSALSPFRASDSES